MTGNWEIEMQCIQLIGPPPDQSQILNYATFICAILNGPLKNIERNYFSESYSQEEIILLIFKSVDFAKSIEILGAL